MKKILILLVLISLLYSCSSNEDDIKIWNNSIISNDGIIEIPKSTNQPNY